MTSEYEMKKILLVLLAAGLVSGVFGLNWIRTRESGRSFLHVATQDALPVVVVKPERQGITRTVHAPGVLEAVLEVEIQSEIAAKIEEMPVEEGDTVQAGQMLCRLNDDEFQALVESGQASVAGLRAGIRQAEAELIKCERDCARQGRLSEVDATSSTELADYHTRLVQAQATVEMRQQDLAQAEAMLRRAQENLGKTVITSPIDGVISKIHAEPGEIVVTGTMNNPGTVIMVATDMSQMQVRARVDETDVPLVKPGQPVDIFLPSNPHRAIPGRVLRVATVGTTPSGRDVVTFETLVLVESDDPAVKPGMTANVQIRVARKSDALTLPVEAVVHRKRRDLPTDIVEAFDSQHAEDGVGTKQSKAQFLKVVFCMVDDQAHLHLVSTGIADDTLVEMTDGVTAEDVVIIGPYRTLDQLKDGTVIEIEESDEGSDDNADVASDESESIALKVNTGGQS